MIKYFFTVACLLLWYISGAQKCSTVVQSAADGRPVSGATVYLMQGNIKMLTQPNGIVYINCTLPDTILVTVTGFIALRLAFSTGNPLPAIIKMQPLAKQLEEVQVSTGYQQLPKERSTGSFEKINTPLFNQQVSASVLPRLEAIANGLYVDKKTSTLTPNYTIRGLSTIQGPKAPLVILDNFPYEGDLNNINPNDVESITILKDAAAASIWGTRAGNGVIVITTKKGKFSQPLQVTLNNSITIGQKPNLFYYNNISPADFIDLEQFLYSKGYYNNAISSSSKPPLSPVVELLIKKANGSLPAADADAKINELKNYDLRNDFSKYMYQPQVNQQYAVSLTGGSSGIAYSFSAGFDDNTGTLNEKYRRLSIRSENIYRLGKKIQLQTALSYTWADSQDGRISYNGISTANGNLPIYTRLADDAGNPLAVIKNYRQPYLDTAGAGKLLNWNYYPLIEHEQIKNGTQLNSFLANTGISYIISKTLQADIKYQYERQTSTGNTIYNQESFTARDLINTFSQLNRLTGIVTYKVPKGGIRISNNAITQAHNIRTQLNFSKTWSKHNLSAIAGSELRQILNSAAGYRTYGYNDNILALAAVDFVTPYPNYVNGSSSLIPNGQSFSEKTNRFVSFYANAAYTFKTKYSITISGRNDASNLFGVETNNKQTPLWSAGVGWNLSKEKWYRLKTLPNLKLRATYGISGNADPARSGYTVLAYSLTSTFTQLPTARIDQFTNPGLRWEKIAIANFGVDFKAFGNRLQGSVEYYRKNGKDLFGYEAVDYTGVPTNRIIKNAASIKASGWDISLNSINIQKQLIWSTDLNFNTNRDQVVSYQLTTKSASNYLNGGLSISALEGKPIYGVYAFAWAGLDPLTGDPMGILKGQPSKDYTALLGSAYPVDSLLYMGRALPALFGSLGNTIQYKGFSVTARLSWKLGYYFLRNSVNYANLFSSRQGHGDYALRWQKPGDELITNVPSLAYPAVSRRDQFYNNAEILVEKADHLRLQYITMSYDFKTAFQWLPVSALNLYININNLGIIWRANKHGIDPDYRDNTILPSKNYAIGIRTTF